MPDLTIHIRYMTKAQLDRLGASIKSPSAAAPGWYVSAYRKDGYDQVLPYTRVDPLTVANAACLLDDDEPTLTNAVLEAVEAAARDEQRMVETLRSRIAADQKVLDDLTGNRTAQP